MEETEAVGGSIVHYDIPCDVTSCYRTKLEDRA